ncbi:MAG: histidine kinase, partial [Alphaproteobacteria bacterium]
MTTSAERAPISAWREQGIYPYLAHPASSVEAIEREVFHHVAWHVQQHLPGFDAAPMRTRAFQFRLLRQAVECGPESLQALLTEALGLPPIDQEILSTQVNGLNLSSVIQTAHVVTERLRFLDGLETIIFDKALKYHVKEREHLHRIVARNAWLFGEDFALSVDNRSLTEVLRKHKASLGEDTLVDPPVGHVTQKRGIVDLVFSRATRYHQPNTLH